MAGVLVTLWSCAQPLSGSAGAEERASVTLSVGGLSSQTILPGVDTRPVHYRLTGTGPNGDSFDVDTADGSATVADLAPGSWSVDAVGTNSAGFPVADGTASVTLEAGRETPVAVPVTVVDGTGTLELSTTWNPEHTVSPSVEAVIVDADGYETTLSVPVDSPGAASTTISGVPVGYHRLSLQLLDGGEVIAGAGESVRIMADVTTTAELPFPDLNKVGEAVSVVAESFVLAWDPPGDASGIESYRVYARPRGEYQWQSVSEVQASETPTLAVTQSLLSYGTWEFAVTAVGGSVESDRHTSMDDDAMPATGWFLEWTAP
ncbi:MAG: hypothetical protein GVY14_08910 [Spirochaetes bacterium]|nr:hypothetical protein [Spirochaetota bacterium]